MLALGPVRPLRTAPSVRSPGWRRTKARFLLDLTGMYVGGSLFLVAIGAILYWAVTFHLTGINLHMVGLILMIVGAIGFLFALVPRRRVL